MGVDLLRGTPHALDEVLRPGVRLVQVMVGLAGTALLWWIGAWWWLPVPLAASFLAYELFFWRRSDRPVFVTMHPDRLVVDDQVRGQHLEVARDDITAATRWRRTRADGRVEVVLRLAGDHGVLLGLRFLQPTGEPAPGDEVDADAADELLGGLAGVLRAVCPLDRLVRQDLGEPDALPRILAWLPDGVDGITVARLWTGEAPSLDLFGLHEGPPDGLLVLTGDRWALHAADGARVDAGPLADLPALQSRTRQTIVWTQGDSAPLQDEGILPLWVVTLGDTRIALPAPRVADLAAEAAPDPSDRHTSLPEGAAVLWHLLRHVPRGRWPAPSTTP